MSSTNIFYIGMGGMGRAMREVAEERGHRTVGVLTSQDDIRSINVTAADVILEATNPSVFLGNLKTVCSLGKPVVVSTTGWYDKMDEVKAVVEKYQIPFMYAANFSIGVHLYFKIVDYAASLINKVEDYDVWAHELHHKYKQDSPSGTAKKLGEILLSRIDRKSAIVEDKLDRKRQDNEIHFSSTRGGAVNFMHRIGFDSKADTIELIHSARDRSGYASGAVDCAEWLLTKSTGFYTMQDYLTDILGKDENI